MTPSFWNGRRVFLTGHTGFKGAWLSLLLAEMGAKVSGYALAPLADGSLFLAANVESSLASSTIGDIRDSDALCNALRVSDPEVVIHMAAQPLVRESYADPIGTYEVNVMGTAHLLEGVRQLPDVRAIVVVTTDKCYENNEWVWGYREVDRLGGHDPYSNSKACCELVTAAYRQSFFRLTGTAVATARAGNVIGGGDWSKDRLVPDIIRGCCGPSGKVVLRNPEAVRPWQHVLEPLRGYLLLAERLASGQKGFDEGWNFGPDRSDQRAVIEVAQALVSALGVGRVIVTREQKAPHEAMLLQLDCAKARTNLGWTPKIRFDEGVALTAAWYASWRRGEDMRVFTIAQIRNYLRGANEVQ